MSALLGTPIRVWRPSRLPGLAGRGREVFPKSHAVLGLPQNFIGMKSTPERPPATTTHDEPASLSNSTTQPCEHLVPYARKPALLARVSWRAELAGVGFHTRGTRPKRIAVKAHREQRTHLERQQDLADGAPSEHAPKEEGQLRHEPCEPTHTVAVLLPQREP
eukprot:scaffold108903_cov69-Phaeocystis_antarctica.AAC.4